MASNPPTVSIFEFDHAGKKSVRVATGELIHPGVVVADGALLRSDRKHKVVIELGTLKEKRKARAIVFAGGVAWLDLATDSEAPPSPVFFTEQLQAEVNSFKGRGPHEGEAKVAFIQELRLRFIDPNRPRPFEPPWGGPDEGNEIWIGCILWGLFCSKTKS